MTSYLLVETCAFCGHGFRHRSKSPRLKKYCTDACKASARNEKKVKAWNQVNRIGTAVVVRRDNGEKFETVTRSEAQLLASGEPVVWVEGIAGCYALGRVRVQKSPQGKKI